jgi:hypothetical protein
MWDAVVQTLYDPGKLITAMHLGLGMILSNVSVLSKTILFK